MIRIIYFGTASFAVPPLEALLSTADVEVAAVVTQPDKPAGRKGELHATPVAEFSRTHSLDLLQLPTLKSDESLNLLKELNADLFVVAAYGKIIPQSVLDLPELGCLNLHGSILPKYRGASPIQAAIAAGEAETGVTLMQMDAEVDHGPVYAEVRLPIALDDTYATLESKMAEAGAALLTQKLSTLADGTLQAKEQDHDQATFTKLIKKEHGLVRWHEETAVEIERKLRAYTPWPGIYTNLPDGKRLKLLEVEMSPTTGTPGVMHVDDGLPAVHAKTGSVMLKTVQPEGKPPMSGKAFLNGNKGFLEAQMA